MNSKELGEDAAFFLYLAPLVAAVAYGVYEWYLFGPKSYSMPGLAYVVVSKDPYLFLGSIVAICVGFILEVRATPFSERNNIVSANTTRMQLLAVVVMIISFAAAISAAGYDIGNGAGNFLTGRYALIFAFFLLGFSILLSPKQLLGNVKMTVAPEFVGLLLMAMSPFAYYGATKLNLEFPLAAGAGIAVLIIGITVLLGGSKIFKRSPNPSRKPVSAQVPTS
ncbi:MAG: hypothetical protein PXY39_14190 [archaeon]|nr:hypothetical protein [archaeon]